MGFTAETKAMATVEKRMTCKLVVESKIVEQIMKVNCLGVTITISRQRNKLGVRMSGLTLSGPINIYV